MILIKVLLLTSFFLLNPVFTVAQNSEPTFGERKNLGLVKNDDITEASGLATSVKNKGVLWTHNDSGDESRIFALDTNGNNLGEFFIAGIENRDWEDIALGSGPDDSKSYVYIGDIGDNDAQHTFKYIYRIEEPTVNIGQEPVVQTISDVSKITFYYNDGERDAETLMIDAPTKDIYIVSKRDSKVRLYKLSYPQSSTNNIEAELAAKFTLPNDPEEDKPFNYITSGDIFFDGTEILLKSYRNIYYWYRENGKSISEVLSSVDPQIVPFNNSIDETQSEAVCWKPFGDRGYYTLSEESVNYNGINLNFPATLYYYPRTSSITSVKSFGLKENFKLE
ncbi:MAG: hypothetical protein H6610_11510, partial [Ignavibacteriales bacterium]|nr:hypothetical protein [Ignavibacteriales bacterium]